MAWPVIPGIVDSDTHLTAAALMAPSVALAQRTEHLRGLIAALDGDARGSLVLNLTAENDVVVGDVVYLNELGVVAKAQAQASQSRDSASYLVADLSAHAIGVVTSRSGQQATVAAGGVVDLSALAVADMLESGELFSAGAYYLSTAEAGKITRTARQPAVFIGLFVNSATAPTQLDFALLKPATKDLWQSHLHYDFPLKGQPAGELLSATVGPTTTHSIRGLMPDAFQSGGDEEGEVPPIRARISGNWSGAGPVTYTLWVTASDDTLATARLHWATNDGSDDVGGSVAEGGVRLVAYNHPTSFGSKGLTFTLEMGGLLDEYVTDYAASDFTALVTTGAAAAELTWTVTVPDRVRGWEQHWIRARGVYVGTTPTTETARALYLFGRLTPLATPRELDELTVTVTSSGDSFSEDTVDLAVTDRDGVSVCTFTNVGISDGGALLIESGTDKYQLWLVIGALDADGAAVVEADGLETTDAWKFTFSDRAPGAAFAYNMGLDPLRRYYPAQPVGATTLVRNGLVLSQRHEFAADVGAYRSAVDTLYWYDETNSEVPFPEDWVSVADPGIAANAQNLMIYLTSAMQRRTGSVTSVVGDGQIAVVDAATGEPASVGNLQLKLSGVAQITDGIASGSKAVKTVGADGKLLSGYVVEKLLAGPGILLSSPDGVPVGQGVVTLSVDLANLSRGDFAVYLANARQELIPNQLFSYTQLLAWTHGSTSNIGSAVVLQMRVPAHLAGTYRLLLYASVFGTVAVGGTPSRRWAGLKVTYSIARDTADGTSILTAPQKSFNLPEDIRFGKTAGAYAAYDPVLIHTDESIAEVDGTTNAAFCDGFPRTADLEDEGFEVLQPGDTIAIKLERTSPGASHRTGSTEYTSPIGFLNFSWRLLTVV